MHSIPICFNSLPGCPTIHLEYPTMAEKDEEQPPVILLVGPRRVGKTSIQRVVFHKMSPHETLFLDPTGANVSTMAGTGSVPGGVTPNSLVQSHHHPTAQHHQGRSGGGPASAASDGVASNSMVGDSQFAGLGGMGSQRPEVSLIANNPLVKFEIWDLPGDFDFSAGAFFQNKVHISEEEIFRRAGALIFVVDAQDQPRETIELLRDVLSRDALRKARVPVEIFLHKMDGDLFQSHQHKAECQTQFQTEVHHSLKDCHVNISYHQTSIYDHTIFDAFSRVVQRLVPHLQVMEKLLDSFTLAARANKAFLYDVVSKLYLVTDSSPPGDHTYELCADMLDVVVDVSCIYGQAQRGFTRTRASTLGPQTPEETTDSVEAELEIEPETYAFDDNSEACIRLGDGMALYLRAVVPYIALVALVKDEVPTAAETNNQSFWGAEVSDTAGGQNQILSQEALEMGVRDKGLLEYNVKVLKDVLNRLFFNEGTEHKEKADTDADNL
eukprot:gb/GECG01013309.1/.p1 GENE.gb/GECG01013309.1/~~gb/GECG01013309.1/.p1  ORF type:complete len:497 (+),score=53.19 gb/GECG01013309.1/:1-1491(+)